MEFSLQMQDWCQYLCNRDDGPLETESGMVKFPIASLLEAKRLILVLGQCVSFPCCTLLDIGRRDGGDLKCRPDQHCGLKYPVFRYAKYVVLAY
jgi:hypothetical protein